MVVHSRTGDGGPDLPISNSISGQFYEILLSGQERPDPGDPSQLERPDGPRWNRRFPAASAVARIGIRPISIGTREIVDYSKHGAGKSAGSVPPRRGCRGSRRPNRASDKHIFTIQASSSRLGARGSGEESLSSTLELQRIGRGSWGQGSNRQTSGINQFTGRILGDQKPIVWSGTDTPCARLDWPLFAGRRSHRRGGRFANVESASLRLRARNTYGPNRVPSPACGGWDRRSVRCPGGGYGRGCFRF